MEREEGLRVLMVEDNPSDQRLIRELLSRSGLSLSELREFSSLSDALSFLSTSTVDVVLLDLSLPDSQGLRTVETLLEQVPDAAVIVLTGLDDEELAHRAVGAGAQDYLTKKALDHQLIRRSVLYSIERQSLRRQLKEESRRAEKNERRFRTIVTSSGSAFVVLDSEGRVKFLNPSAEELLGLTCHELLGKPLPVRNLPLASGVVEIPPRGGELRFAQACVSDIYWENKPARLLSLTDITDRVRTLKLLQRTGEELELQVEQKSIELERLAEPIRREVAVRKEVERRLRENRDTARFYLDIAGVIIASLDPEGDVKLINKKGCEVLGLGEEEIVGKNWFECFVPPQSMQEQKKHFEKMISRRAQCSVFTESTVLTADGSRRIIQWFIRLEKDDYGRVIGAIGSGLDVTELRLAEDSLRESEEKYRAIFELCPELIALVDVDGKILEINARVHDWLGYEREEAIGSFFHELPWMTEESKSVSVQFFRRRLKGEEVPPYDIELLTKRGERKKARVRAGPMVRNGEIVGVLAIVSDITEQSKILSQLLGVAKMEAIGRLTGGIAHDLNNTLTAVTGFSELALRSLPEGHPASAQIREIKRAAESAANLTRQLLTFSRRQLVQPEVININATVRAIENMLKRLLGEDIELRTSLHPDLWNTRIDPAQVEQLIVNMAVNAREAMPAGGILRIETSNEVLDEVFVAQNPGSHTGEYVLLTISDTGVGMSEEVKRNIFDPFFTTKERGTGLGLSTCYGIIKQNDGYIRVKSEPGKGTTFDIYLPRTLLPLKSQTETRAASRVPTGSETVLVVEDESLVRQFSVSILKELGYTVLQASDGEEAIRLVESYGGEKINLLITDIVMPRLSGRELAEQLTKSYPGMKVLYITGYTDDEMVRRGLEVAEVELLQKPFSVEQLAERVRQILGT